MLKAMAMHTAVMGIQYTSGRSSLLGGSLKIMMNAAHNYVSGQLDTFGEISILPIFISLGYETLQALVSKVKVRISTVKTHHLLLCKFCEFPPHLGLLSISVNSLIEEHVECLRFV